MQPQNQNDTLRQIKKVLAEAIKTGEMPDSAQQIEPGKDRDLLMGILDVMAKRNKIRAG